MSDQWRQRFKSVELVAIGASAGGIETLMRVFGALRQPFHYAIACVLHIAPKGSAVLPEVFAQRSPIKFK